MRCIQVNLISYAESGLGNSWGAKFGGNWNWVDVMRLAKMTQGLLMDTVGGGCWVRPQCEQQGTRGRAGALGWGAGR